MDLLAWLATLELGLVTMYAVIASGAVLLVVAVRAANR